MLTTVDLYKLVENTKANRALCDNLLPLNKNASILDVKGFNSLTVVEDDLVDPVPVAFGLFSMCNPSQVYCAVVSASNRYDNVFVNLETVKMKPSDLGVLNEDLDQHSVRKIKNVISELPDLSSLPQYYRAFGKPAGYPLHQCVVNELIECTVGEKNFDMKRNVTVDLYDLNSNLPEHSDELWRDYAGFIIRDKHRFAEFEIETKKLVYVLTKSLAKLSPVDELSFQSLSPKTSSLFYDYDQNLSIMDRQAVLEYLFSIQRVSGTVALDAEQRPVGYVVSLNDRILQCYANTSAIAHQLMLEHLKHTTQPLVKFFAAAHDQVLFEALSENAEIVRRVRRYHSRIMPSSVKWSQIFAFNVGVHLF